jgi:cytoskeleton protein RodZ
MNDVGPTEEGVVLTPGQQLASARAACGLSVADIARQLKLSSAQVEAIEAEQYDRLPGAVFVRGFIRNYARLVKLAPEPLLASAGHESMPPVQTKENTPPSAEIPFPTGREIKWHRYAIVFAVLATPILIYEFSRDDAPQVTVKPRQVTLPEPQVTPEAKQGASQAVAPQDVSRPTASVAPARPPEKAAQPAAAKAKRGERVVKLVFEKESWVEIRDGGGRRILYQLNPAGSEQAVSGAPPLSLIVGNAAGVRVTVNEQPVDLAPHTKTDDVARLTLE